MAHIERILPPEHLNHDTLSEQHKALISEDQLPMAKDLNIINNKLDWLIRVHVDDHNVLADHDKEIEDWRFTRRLYHLVFGGGGLVVLGLAIWKIFH